MHEYGTLALAWLSWVLAAAGGSALAGTFLGGMVVGFLGWFPAWIAALLLGAGTVAMLLDMFLDLTPNRLAIMCGILLPSVARAVDGRLGDEVTELAGRIRTQLDAWTVDWLGAAPTIGLGLFCVAASLLMARRVVVKGG
jgi:hypothetical protein